MMHMKNSSCATFFAYALTSKYISASAQRSLVKANGFLDTLGHLSLSLSLTQLLTDKINDLLELTLGLLGHLHRFLNLDLAISRLEVYKHIVIGVLIAQLQANAQLILGLEQLEIPRLFRQLNQRVFTIPQVPQLNDGRCFEDGPNLIPFLLLEEVGNRNKFGVTFVEIGNQSVLCGGSICRL